MRLDWSKMTKQFSVNSREKFLCQYQTSRQAVSKHLACSLLSHIFRYFPAFQVVIFVEYPVLFLLSQCLIDFKQVLLTFTKVCPYNFHVLQ